MSIMKCFTRTELADFKLGGESLKLSEIILNHVENVSDKDIVCWFGVSKWRTLKFLEISSKETVVYLQ